MVWIHRALLYGGLGVEISKAILSSVYPPGVAYGVDGVLLPVHSVTVNKSISSITEASTCLTQYVNNLKVEHLDVLDNTALTAMLSVSSVRYALQVHIITANYNVPATRYLN